jgi:hypothetical protein
MIRITSILATPSQTFQTPLADGSMLRFELIFRPRIPAFYVNITYGDFTINGLKLCNSVNLLWQFRNLPFGLCISLNDGTEPYFIDDFSTGRADFMILEKDDLDYVKSIAGGLD